MTTPPLLSSGPNLHAQALRARGRSQVVGPTARQMYIDLGLRLDTADNAVEAGIYRAWQRLSSGRLNPPKREGIEFPFHRGHRGGGTWMG